MKALGVDDKNKVKAISNPASFPSQPRYLAQKENRIIFVGRLSFTQKRVDRLMAVIANLHENFNDWSFDIVGEGDKMAWMREYCFSKDLDRVYFHGYQKPEVYLKKAKIFLLTSDFEGFPMVIQEAQAYGVIPVVTPCFSAVHEVVGEGSGIVLSDNNPESMVKMVEKLIKHPLLLNAIANSALRNVSRFNSKSIVKKWVTLLDTL